MMNMYIHNQGFGMYVYVHTYVCWTTPFAERWLQPNKSQTLLPGQHFVAGPHTELLQDRDRDFIRHECQTVLSRDGAFVEHMGSPLGVPCAAANIECLDKCWSDTSSFSDWCMAHIKLRQQYLHSMASKPTISRTPSFPPRKETSQPN